MTTETTPSESTRNATITKTPGRDPAGVLAARVLARASMSENTRRVYATALRAFEGSGVPETGAGVGAFPGEFYEEGLPAAYASLAAAALRFRARLQGRACFGESTDPFARRRKTRVKLPL